MRIFYALMLVLISNSARAQKAVSSDTPISILILAKHTLLATVRWCYSPHYNLHLRPDPSSSYYKLRPSPMINSQGMYEVNHKGRNIRVYNQLDVALLLEDFYDKLALVSQTK